MKIVRVGSRESALAIRQSEMVIEAIKSFDPSIQVELVTIKTTGDRILDRPLAEIGGKGLFTQELDSSLRDGRIDIAVHSAKDLPAELPEGLPIAAFSRREDPRDALILPEGSDKLSDAPIGSSSQRRCLQLAMLYPGRSVSSVRGNVHTRLKKLDHGEYSALVLAAAGLLRLGLAGRISRRFEPEEMLPSACQGIIAVQAREGEDTSYLSVFDNNSSRLCALAERAFVAKLGGGCTSPIAAHAVMEGNNIRIRGLYVSDDGRMARGETEGKAENGRELAAELAGKLMEECGCQAK